MCCSESDSPFHLGEILLYLGGRDTKENSGDIKIIPLNIAISKAAESGSVNAVTACASLSRHLPGDADKGSAHALGGKRKISTQFNPWFSGRDKGTKLVPASPNPGHHGQGHWHREGHRRALPWLEESCWTQSHRCTVPQFPSVLGGEPREKTFYRMFWHLQVTLYHNVAQSMWAQQFPASHYLQTTITKKADNR